MNENKKFVKAFFTLLSKHTNVRIDLFYITDSKLRNRNMGRKITIAREIPIRKAYGVLMNDNAVWKNSPMWQDRYNVYFAPSKEQNLNIAFVDDLQDAERFVCKKHFCLVQTSEEKYQGYFLLSEYCTPEKILQIQRRLCEIYGGDKGALSPHQLRRVPGFYNTKYVMDFLVRVAFVGNKVIKVSKIEKDLRCNLGVRQAKLAGGVYSSLENLEDAWEYYLKIKGGDRSRADFSFCLFLINRGYSDEKVKMALLEYSKGIRERKGKYLDDYLERTVKKARSWVKEV